MTSTWGALFGLLNKFWWKLFVELERRKISENQNINIISYFDTRLSVKN